jgi:hypothetical protein
MIVSHEHKFVFIKTKKTAGSTIERILYHKLNQRRDICSGSTRDQTPALNCPPDMNGHIGWKQIQHMYPKPIANFFVFTIERNPWDKAVSQFFWHKQIKPHIAVGTFPEYLRRNQGLLAVDWGNYTDRSGKVKAHVFQYEELHTVIPTLNEKLGLDLDPNLIHNTKLKSGLREEKHYSEYYDEWSRNYIAQRFENEIKEFGYEFEQR